MAGAKDGARPGCSPSQGTHLQTATPAARRRAWPWPCACLQRAEVGQRGLPVPVPVQLRLLALAALGALEQGAPHAAPAAQEQQVHLHRLQLARQPPQLGVHQQGGPRPRLGGRQAPPTRGGEGVVCVCVVGGVGCSGRRWWCHVLGRVKSGWPCRNASSAHACRHSCELRPLAREQRAGREPRAKGPGSLLRHKGRLLRRPRLKFEAVIVANNILKLFLQPTWEVGSHAWLMAQTNKVLYE